MAATNNLQETITKIEAELERLDACDSEHNCYGCVVYADSDLPEGVIRFADGTGNEVFCNAAELLDALKEITEFNNTADFDDGDDESETGWYKAWVAAGDIAVKIEAE